MSREQLAGQNITGRNDDECCGVRNTWLSTFDGRVGYPIGNTLAYIKGGLAVGNVEQTIGDYSATGTNVGWDVGAGLEWSFAKGWFFKLEYDHVDLGNVPRISTVCGPDANTKYEDNRFMIGVGGWVSPFNSYFSSDARLKSDIVTLGHLDNGLAVYRFRYAGSNKVYVGVMAQEVQMVRPDAVTRGEDGYLLVNYDRLGLAHGDLGGMGRRAGGPLSSASRRSNNTGIIGNAYPGERKWSALNGLWPRS